jgi:hypothetical protein
VVASGVGRGGRLSRAASVLRFRMRSLLQNSAFVVVMCTAALIAAIELLGLGLSQLQQSVGLPLLVLVGLFWIAIILIARR